MIVYFGKDLFGRVERCLAEGRETLYIETLFFHIFLFPLIPLRSYLVVAGTDQAVELPLNWKSVGLAYLRAVLFILLLVSGLVVSAGVIGLFVEVNTERVLRMLALWGTVFGLSAGLWWIARHLGLATPERAEELGAKFGLVNPVAQALEQRLNLLQVISQKFAERMLDPTIVEELEGEEAEGQRLFKELAPVTANLWRKYGPMAMAHVMLDRRDDTALRDAYLTGPEAGLYHELSDVRRQLGLEAPEEAARITAAWVGALMEVGGGGELTTHSLRDALQHPIGQYILLGLECFESIWEDAEARLHRA
ncbi:MAG: hypothetical protein AB7S38_23095 [Vulcanimicrobiota bacterium]